MDSKNQPPPRIPRESVAEMIASHVLAFVTGGMTAVLFLWALAGPLTKG